MRTHREGKERAHHTRFSSSSRLLSFSFVIGEPDPHRSHQMCRSRLRGSRSLSFLFLQREGGRQTQEMASLQGRREYSLLSFLLSFLSRRVSLTLFPPILSHQSSPETSRNNTRTQSSPNPGEQTKSSSSSKVSRYTAWGTGRMQLSMLGRERGRSARSITWRCGLGRERTREGWETR